MTEILNPKVAKPKTYQEGYNYVVKTWKDAEFAAFYDELHKNGVEAALTLEKKGRRFGLDRKGRRRAR